MDISFDSLAFMAATDMHLKIFVSSLRFCFHTKLYSNLRIGEVVICTETVLSTAQNPASDLTYFSLYTRGRLMNGVNTFLPNTNPHIGCIHLQWQKVSHITNNSAQV